MSASEIPQALVQVLAEAGSDTVFGMPGGGSNLDVIGAAEAAGMRFILAHGETSAVLMAAVYGDLTGRPTACVVTRGPGAASAVNGVANALLDRQAVILVADSVDTAAAPRILHQQLDQVELFRPIAKWSTSLTQHDPERTAREAVDVAMAGPPGPVVLTVDPPGYPSPGPGIRPKAHETNGPEDWAEVRAAIAMARRPIIVLGTGARSAEVEIRSLLAGTDVPVLTTYRAKGLIPESWPNAAGIMTGAAIEAPLLHQADLIVFIGVDTVEFIPNPWPYAAPVVSVAGWPEASSYLDIAREAVGDVAGLVGELGPVLVDTDWEPATGSEHRATQLARLRGAVEGEQQRDAASGLTPAQIVTVARQSCPAGTIATVDAGAHMLPAMELWQVEAPDEVLISSGLATMGFSLPAAIGAALARPGRRVIAFIGDGGLGMCAGELETLVRYSLPVTVIVFNDSRLSLIAIKAKPSGHGGENAVAFTDVDFALMGRAYGLSGYRVDTPEALASALSEQVAASGPGLIDVRTDPQSYPHLMQVIRGVR